MSAFWIAFGLVMIAEMGDKTQLIALAFATRFNTTVVVTGVFGATIVVHLFSVLIGEAAGSALPVFWINLISGIAFVGFGLWTIRGDKIEDEETEKESRLGPVFTVATTFFLAELGDKTMLATVAIASQQSSFVGVWLGSTMGMVVADGIAIIVGKVMGMRLPERLIKYVAALIFFASGIVTIFLAFRHR